MLTIEKLKANAELAKLDEATLKLIQEMSGADEKIKVDEVTRTLHGGYDKDIKRITGLDKPRDLQTYQHMAKLLEETWPLKEKVASLEKQIADGNGDEALKKQIADLKTEIKKKDDKLSTVQNTLDTKTTEFQKQLADKDLEVQKTITSLEFAEAEKGIAFKDVYGDRMLKETIERRRNQILENVTIEKTKDSDGKESTILRGADQSILTNKDDNFKPHTLQSYYLQEIGDLIDSGKKVPGGGTKPPAKPGDKPSTLDMSNVKDQFEASTVIEKHLLTRGIKSTDSKYGEEMAKIWDEHKVEDLPQRVEAEPEA